jgi:hypothetical protein
MRFKFTGCILAGTEFGALFFDLLPLFVFSLCIKGQPFVLISVMLATMEDVNEPLDKNGFFISALVTV